MTRLSLALLFTLLTATATAQPWSSGGWQQAQGGTVTVDDLMGSDDPRLLISLDEAVEQVRRETGGRVLSAKTVHQGDALVHRIKVLTPQKQVQIHEIEAGDAR
jgi:uncharacterized membrane protein YkoI